MHYGKISLPRYFLKTEDDERWVRLYAGKCGICSDSMADTGRSCRAVTMLPAVTPLSSF